MKLFLSTNQSLTADPLLDPIKRPQMFQMCTDEAGQRAGRSGRTAAMFGSCDGATSQGELGIAQTGVEIPAEGDGGQRPRRVAPLESDGSICL